MLLSIKTPKYLEAFTCTEIENDFEALRNRNGSFKIKPRRKQQQVEMLLNTFFLQLQKMK